MTSFFDLDPPGLEAYCRERDMPRHTADQLLDWVYRKAVTDPEEMTNISRAHRDVLHRTMQFYTGAIEAHQLASDGTQKLLIAWFEADEPAGEAGLPVLDAPHRRRTECVMIPAEPRTTACISSQVGCPVGCRFCASGLGGLEGNLGTGRIVEQVHRLAAFAPGGRISNVVFMGMGEPLANLAAVTGAIRALNASWGMGIGARRITVSTVGLPAAIRRLADFELPVTLALSLHAPNDEIRRRLIPWAQYATIDELLDACDAYFDRTGREITLEYLLLRKVNDRPEHARELSDLARRLRANVNLIRYNEVRGLPFDRPTTDDVHAFQGILRRRGVNVHLRASRGRDIAAACGQLRHERSAADRSR
ncbi:MAG: 23S rRNA (adenine(2503)-C(2))-methyltransferase RlmN [Planctomycetota bacterium]|nr:23S rRNA (adenine(2503)-C(2))-methyltransferase RlmN [Planctomycetota bacterium]